MEGLHRHVRHPGTGNRDTYPHRIISTSIRRRAGHRLLPRPISCIGPFDSKSEAESVLSYLCCRLTRFLISAAQAIAAHDCARSTRSFRRRTWTKPWTDEDLYEKYGLTDERNRVHREAVVRWHNGDLFDEAATTVTMSKPIEEILAPKPEARPRIYAYSIDDKAHKGLLKVGQTTRNVKQRVAEQLKTAAIKNYKIELDESAERDDGTIFSDHEVRAALVRKKFANPELEWMRCSLQDVKTVLTELRTGQRFTGTHHRTISDAP